MKRQYAFCLITLFLILNLQSLLAEQVKSGTTLVGSSGGTSASGQYSMYSAVGQPLAGNSSSPSFSQGIGFLPQSNGGGQLPAPSFFYANGWNLVSVPFIVPNNSKSTIFPTGVSQAFAYNGGYQQTDTLKMGIGYWLKFSGNQALALHGAPNNSDTIDLNENWNLIGGISSPVDTENIITLTPNLEISNFFGYQNGYTVAGVIEPGKGYWVKSNQAGSFVLQSAPPSKNTMKLETPEQPDLSAYDNITIEQIDKNSLIKMSKKLFFATTLQGDFTIHHFELPPVPPRGVFDVRYPNNSYMEVLPDEVTKPVELPLRIQASNSQIHITLDLHENAHGYKYSLIEKSGKRILSSKKLESKRSVTINVSEDAAYSLKIETVPKAFQLYQNYPNPFNPLTSIRYDLPVSATVTLQVFNLLGQLIQTYIDNQILEEGQHEIELQASSLASGTYFYRLTATNIETGRSFTDTKTMMLIK